MTNQEFNGLLANCFQEPGNPAPVERLCRSIRPFLYVYLLKISPADSDIAEDALQNSFLKLLAILKKRNSPRGLNLGYFVTIAKHCMIDEIRRRKRLISLDDLVEEQWLLQASELKAKALDFSSYEDVLLLAMEQLGGRCRFILERYYIAGIKGPQLAVELDISPLSIPMTVKRCRDELKHILLTWTT